MGDVSSANRRPSRNLFDGLAGSWNDLLTQLDYTCHRLHAQGMYYAQHNGQVPELLKNEPNTDQDAY